MVSAGKEVLAYCTSCRMDLNHTIEAMTGDRIARVMCRTCRKSHTYRPPKGMKTPAAKGTTSRARKTAPKKETRTVEAEWERLMEEHKDSPLKTYSARSSFEAGDRISHPKFGDGIVEKTVHPNKVEIVFRNDVKTLIHAG